MIDLRRVVLPVVTASAAVFLLSGCHSTQRAASVPPAAGQREVVEERWPNGKLRLHKEMLRRPDGRVVEHGVYTTWYDHGGREYEGTFVQGEVDGVVATWHRNGLKATEQHFRGGRRHGPRYSWDDNGVLRKEEHFADDQPTGTWTVWDAKGEIKIRRQFDPQAPHPDSAPADED
jgi:hypothetical protein